jgi:hypothetical protein
MVNISFLLFPLVNSLDRRLPGRVLPERRP